VARATAGRRGAAGGWQCHRARRAFWYEGLPKTIIEAFSVGTPIVASDLGAMSEVIEHEKTGALFEPGNSEELFKALQCLQWMASSPQRAKSMRTRVREVFEQRYTADRNYEILIDIYRQVLSEHSESAKLLKN